MSLVIANAELDGQLTDIRIADGRVTAIEAGVIMGPADDRYDAAGGAVLPGLHDHHLHLLAMAAAAASVQCGPPGVTSAAELTATLQQAARTNAAAAELRGVGYHESVAGALDRDDLDRIVSDRPLRIQHRGGALWILNSAALHRYGLLTSDPTGRLWRRDQLFHGDAALPDLQEVVQRLLSFGITGVTDATPDLDQRALDHLVAARRSGGLPQRLTLLGAPDGWTDSRVEVGPWKLLLHDHDLPTLDDLIATIAASHAALRPVAVHCVTRTSLVLTLAAIESVGALPGDRIEHGAIVPPELRGTISRLGLRVVTQPSFVHDRGDDYLASVDPDDLPLLYPFGSLLAAGIPVAASSDAPFGTLDPWQAIAVATTRATMTGSAIAAEERVTAHQALAGYLSRPELPGGPPRTITVGAADELCVLAEPLAVALANPAGVQVRLTIAGDARYDATT